MFHSVQLIQSALLFLCVNADISIPDACQGCGIYDAECSCTLEIKYAITLMLDDQPIRPNVGELQFANGTILTPHQRSRVITTDGENHERVITVNGQFPGPNIVVYEDQKVSITIVNNLQTDSTTVHFHGIHQHGTPYADGVPFVTQCPVAPGQSFVHSFIASPRGTHFYHSHLGDQRSLGLYGGFIVKKRKTRFPDYDDEFVVILQDWNHDTDLEPSKYRVSVENEFVPRFQIPTMHSIDNAKLGPFRFHSGLINGKGRFYSNLTSQNGSPLYVFEVELGRRYLFRVICAATALPFLVRIQDHKLLLVASDGFDFRPLLVDSFVIQPGERFDFILIASNPTGKNQYMLVAESLEVDLGDKYHAAEAIIRYNVQRTFDPNPPLTPNVHCNANSSCKILNCPFPKFPDGSYKECIDFTHIRNSDARANEEIIAGTPDKEIFLNFGFPGYRGTTPGPGSINGHQFVFPPAPILIQRYEMEKCDPNKCRPDTTCQCTFAVNVERGDLIQMVFTNVGNASGWSHPIHLHGHSMYVLDIGYGFYDQTSGIIMGDNELITCDNPSNFCNDVRWKDRSSLNGSRTKQQHGKYPRKDTIIVPTGGFVVVRFRANNLGAWFLHCHVDRHSNNGMAMVLMEATDKIPRPPVNVSFCGDSELNEKPMGEFRAVFKAMQGNTVLHQHARDEDQNDWQIFLIVVVLCGVILLATVALSLNFLSKTFKGKKINYQEDKTGTKYGTLFLKL